ncbi:hypothetical protein BJY01DRAFT_239685 [Aspergillus pseudoustus]|uniref:Heterokaryon incompatibility domain-containing protein n=1 Tax=Aspergillus pseudoustus TaxID=1810923 RepID=A0ABR4IY77_9EURO
MIRIFGNLWLPDPEQALPAHELLHTRRLLALIQAFEARQAEEANPPPDQNSFWNLDEAFECFRKKEVAWWIEQGVARPIEHLVRPSGHLNAPIACHLYNPTFSVDDPSCQETEDFSNFSLVQLRSAGFSTEKNCLIFDHLARRDVSKHYIHEEFMFALRAAMKAKVEICWGANVRERMMKKLCLEALRLWGEFTGLVLYLDLTPDKTSLIRFVIFVAHPQRFMYVKGDGENARAWRRRSGAPQDHTLLVGARLCDFKITPSFYELDPRLPQNLCVSREMSARRNLWKGQAVAQLKKAFPDAVLSAVRHQTALLEVLTQVKPGKTRETATIPDVTDDRILRDIRLRKIAAYWTNLRMLLSMFTDATPNLVPQKLQSGSVHLLTALSEQLPEEVQNLDCWDWEELPEPIANFIQLQDGLKFNKRKISTRSDLELAFFLLQRCEGDPRSFNIFTLAASVLIAYGWMITRSRKTSVDRMIILRERPSDTVARKCSGCGNEHLDDPFPYWSRFDPDRYIQGNLKKKNIDQFDAWFLLRPTEYGVLHLKWKSYHGFDITRYPRRPDIYFNKDLTIAGRIAALVEAQKLLEDGESVPGTRSASEMDDEVL